MKKSRNNGEDKQFAETTISWPDAEKRIRRLILEGRYLTPEELEQYWQTYPEQPETETAEPSADTPEPAPLSEITDADIDKLLIEDWGIVERKQKIYALYLAGKTDEEISWTLNSEYLSRSYGEGNRQTSGPCALADGSAAFARYDYGMNIVSRPRGASRFVSYEEMARHIRRLIDEGRYLSPDELARYNADHAPEARTAAETPEPSSIQTIPAEQKTPAFANPQDAIDAALQEWNGDIASKRAVSRYMEDHARDRDTAQWLKKEYGDDLPSFPVPAAQTDLPWPKVQRRLALLIKEDRFFTEEELDNFADVDTTAVRENLEQAGNRPSPFVEQVMADVEPRPTIGEIYEKYKPLVKNLTLADEKYQNACQNSDRETAMMEGHEAVKRAVSAMLGPDVMLAPDFIRLYYDMANFRDRLHREILDETYPVLSQPQPDQAAPPDLSTQLITREGDTLTIGTGEAAHEIDVTLSDTE